jgi:hypothetical protein
MKTLIEALTIILLAVPVAVLIIWNLPGLGALAAFVLLAGYLYYKAHKEDLPRANDATQDKVIGIKKAA